MTICLYGNTGSGKTRVLQLMEKQLPVGSCLRVGVETVHDDYVAALRAGCMNSISKYETVSHLLLDNLWLLSRRPAFTAIVCQLLANRIAADRVTVIASDLDLATWQEHDPQLAAILAKAETFRMQP